METVKNELMCQIVEKTGESKKTGKPYTMYILRVETEKYGALDIVLNTYSDRAGILLSALPPDNE